MIVYFNQFDKISEKSYAKMYDFLPNSRKQKVDANKIEINKKITIIEYFLIKKHLKLQKNTDFSYTAAGKPYIEGCLNFNISHSENMLVVAFNKAEVGVDVQKIVEYNAKLANKICNQKELAELNLAEDKNLKFTEIWTLKESYLKLKGQGIYTNLKDVLKNKDFKFKYFYVEDYVICVCVNI